jgi:hypothetical protein
MILILDYLIGVGQQMVSSHRPSKEMQQFGRIIAWVEVVHQLHQVRLEQVNGK